MSYISVEGRDDLVRDKNSGAILNINRNEIQNARKRKQIAQQKIIEEEQLKKDVASLKEDMEEIKTLLGKLAERL